MRIGEVKIIRCECAHPTSREKDVCVLARADHSAHDLNEDVRFGAPVALKSGAILWWIKTSKRVLMPCNERDNATAIVISVFFFCSLFATREKHRQHSKRSVLK